MALVNGGKGRGTRWNSERGEREKVKVKVKVVETRRVEHRATRKEGSHSTFLFSSRIVQKE